MLVADRTVLAAASMLPLAAAEVLATSTPACPFEHSTGLSDHLADQVDDASLLESVYEAAFTLSIFLAVWGCGYVLMHTRMSYSGKGASKGAKSRAASTERKQQQKLVEPTSPLKGSTAEPASTSIPPSDVSKPLSSGSRSSSEGRLSQPLRKRSALAQETDVLATAVRNDQVVHLPEMLRSAVDRCTADCDEERAQHRLTSCVVAVLRACAAKRYFQQGLSAYDAVASRLVHGSTDCWSLLLWCAVEVDESHRCNYFLGKLCSLGQPSKYDIVNVVHHCVKNTKSPEELATLLNRFHRMGCLLDTFARNRALAICISKGAVDLAEVLVEHSKEVPMDTIAYNTLMKGYAVARNHRRCLQLYGEMRRQSRTPSDVTFGILIDTCIDAGELEQARKVFTDLQACGFQLNVVLFTTFIKGLAAAGEIDEALTVLGQMENTPHCRPDVVTYTTVAKGFAKKGDIEGGIRLIARMTERGIPPDAAVFHTVFGACCVKAMPSGEIMRQFERLITIGMRPSPSALSILLKACAKSQAWDEALSVLEHAQEKYRLNVDERLFVQLARASAEEGRGSTTLQIYGRMLRFFNAGNIPVDRNASMRMMKLCVQTGEGRIASSMHDEVCRMDGYINIEAIDEVMPKRFI